VIGTVGSKDKSDSPSRRRPTTPSFYKDEDFAAKVKEITGALDRLTRRRQVPWPTPPPGHLRLAQSIRQIDASANS